MKNNNQINADLQRKVARQKQELTRAYEQLATQRETIRNLCKVRDEAKQMWFYIQGLEANVKHPIPVMFNEIEKVLFGNKNTAEILYENGFEPKSVNWKNYFWERQ